MRCGIPAELDVDATVKRICQQGFFLEPVLAPSRANKIELILLIDQSNSMLPFHNLAERLIETARDGERVGQVKVYYFNNAIRDFLYLQPNLEPFKKDKITDLTIHWHQTRTTILIFSDGGAARGGFNPGRIRLTREFFGRIKPTVKQVTWLNPIPNIRWGGTTADGIAEFVPMFEFSLSGWQKTIGNLRGQGLRREKDTKQELGSVDGALRFANAPYFERGLGGEDALKYEIAVGRICSFADRGDHYLELAYLAAFPLALTPDLLYYLRANFQFDCEGNSYEIPWIGIPDLLLSNLCQPRGYCLYEMDSAVRHLLLKHLKLNPRFGNERLNQLSDALLFYIWQGIPDGSAADFGENPQWIALAYTQPNELARELALKLQELYAGDKQAQIQAASLIATFSEPLAESNFQPLLTFARGLGRLARGNQNGADEQFNQLPAELTLAGVKLKKPGGIKLQTFDFEGVTVNSRGKIVTRESKQASYFTEDLGNNITLEMVAIPGGTFLMGSPKTEAERFEDEDSQHSVSVPSFFMGKYQITQAQWQAVAALPKINRDLESNPSYFKGENLPVENVSWLDAVEFCARLSQKTKREYRLPSEAEWEYACRAGTTTPFHFGKIITTDLANYKGNYTAPKGTYRGKTTPVGSFGVANNFGLYDMHGNVWEWCTDDWRDNYEGAPTDGSAWGIKLNNNDNNSHVRRGGSWYNYPRRCRSACRNSTDAGNRNLTFGFRVVCSSDRI